VTVHQTTHKQQDFSQTTWEHVSDKISYEQQGHS
jgi:hypothetical protein